MYVRGYLQGSENGRVVTIDLIGHTAITEMIKLQFTTITGMGTGSRNLA